MAEMVDSREHLCNELQKSWHTHTASGSGCKALYNTHIASMHLTCALAPDTHHAPDSVSTAPLIMIMSRYEKFLGARDHADMTFPASNDRHRIVRAKNTTSCDCNAGEAHLATTVSSRGGVSCKPSRLPCSKP